MPRISVVMPVYNNEAYLSEAIECIRNQTLSDLELIIVDDGSSDGSSEIARSHCRSDPRIVLIENGRNLGIAASVNRALARANGMFVARVDADDITYARRLEHQTAALESNAGRAAVLSDYELVDRRGRPLRRVRTRIAPRMLRWLLLFKNPAGGNRIMFRRSAAEQIGLYDSRFAVSEDHDFAARLQAVGEIAFVPSVDIGYRQHPENASKLRREDMWKNAAAIMKRGVEEEIGRTLEDSVTAELAAMWRVRTAPAGSARTVSELLEEVATKFAVRVALTAEEMACLRRLTAGRFAIRSAWLALKRNHSQSAEYRRAAFRWSPAGAMAGLRFAANLLVPFGPLLVDQ